MFKNFTLRMLTEAEWRIKSYGHGFGRWQSINSKVNGQLGCSHEREVKIKNGSEKQTNNIQGERFKSADLVAKQEHCSESARTFHSS